MIFSEQASRFATFPFAPRADLIRFPVMYNPNLHFHFTGIGGSGMSGIAEILLGLGFVVSGSDARPSDAIALAVRYGCPIFVGQDVLDTVNAKVIENGDVITLEMRTGEVNGPDGDDDSSSGGYSTLDKESWEGVLEAMDPEDFKYKM